MENDERPTGQLRQRLSRFLRFGVPDLPSSYEVHETVTADGYQSSLIGYAGDEGEAIPAYLLLPEGPGPFAGVVVHHQHHGQRHLGKSEVCGLTGDPLQAFGPALARRGLAVLAPDALCFEDRRQGRQGIEPDAGDVAQHYGEMCYRLVHGDTLMRKALSDSAQALSVLRAHPLVDAARTGLVGHSFGGTVTLFHGALDERIAFACASGAAGSLREKVARRTGLDMVLVIPAFARQFDIEDLVTCFAPRPLLLVSATEDPHAQDAEQIVAEARQRWAVTGIEGLLAHRHYEGGHALTPERVETIVAWVARQASPDGT